MAESSKKEALSIREKLLQLDPADLEKVLKGVATLNNHSKPISQGVYDRVQSLDRSKISATYVKRWL